MKITFKYISICFITAFFAVSAQARSYNQKFSMPVDSMLNEPAPDFILKDLNGKTVSLSDYKGKTLVLDFWATWCVPCRESFPATQILINKYKDDPNVKFLFIDTREKGDDYVNLIKKLLNDNHYTFNVILDEKGTDGIQNKIYKQYIMPGIPTKFIIDGKGIIRYKSIGYNPNLSTDDAVKEVAEMIDATVKS